MKDLISVVVPVYNTGEPLRRCINSILNQTYSPIEIILVDDGSTDKATIDICDEYALNNPSVRLVRQANGGPSKARNTGINSASGKYIVFVDSDDYIDPDGYQNLYENAIKYDAKLVLGTMCISGSKQLYGLHGLTEGINGKKAVLSRFLQGYWHSTCTNLYERELIGDLRFPLNEINEDYIFNFEVLLKCNDNVISVHNRPFYHYVKQQNSRTSAPASLKHLDWLKHTEFVRSKVATVYGKSLGEEAEFQMLFANIVLANKSILSIYRDIKEEPSEIYALTTSNLKRMRKAIIKNKCLSLRFRIFGILLGFVPNFYKYLTLTLLKLKR